MRRYKVVTVGVRREDVRVGAQPFAAPTRPLILVSWKKRLHASHATFTYVLMPERISVAVRLAAALVDRIDAISARLSSRAAGTVIKRSDTIRLAIERGVDTLEQELNVALQKSIKPKNG